MKKRMFGLVIALVCITVLLTALPVGAAETRGTCGDNVNWKLDSGILTISGSGEITSAPWLDFATEIQEVVVKEGVTVICEGAFTGCTSLRYVTLEPGVTKICEQAFYTGGTAYITMYMMGDCPEFENYWYRTAAARTSIDLYYPMDNPSWANADSIAISGYTLGINYGTSGTCGDGLTYTISGTVLTISGTGDMYSYDRYNMPPWMYYDRTITKVVMESGITSISHKAFIQFKKLTEVSIPNTVKTIGGQAFGECSALKEITIPDSVESVGDFCFNMCTSLETVRFGKGLTTLKDDVLSQCTSLKNIYFYGDAIAWLDYYFSGVTATVYYPVNNATWTEEMRPTNGGSLTWIAFCGYDHNATVDPGVAASCTADGLTQSSHCSVCGEVITAQQTIPATGHKEVTDQGKAATCTEDGLTQGSHCSSCGEVIAAQKTISATGHSFGQWTVTKEATQDSEGTEERVCTVCSATEQRTLDKLPPAETEPVETEPVETEPVETEPVATEPVETEPTETEPVETDPVKTNPAETEPDETQPATTVPDGTQPAGKTGGNGSGWVIAVVVVALAGAAAAVVINMKRKK